MKNIIKYVLGILIVASSFLGKAASIETAAFEWNPVVDPDFTGYRLYFSKDSNHWTHVKSTTLTTTVVELPTPGIWHFIVVAVANRLTGGSGTNRITIESLPSNMVSYEVPQRPGASGSLRLVSGFSSTTLTVSSNLIFLP